MRTRGSSKLTSSKRKELILNLYRALVVLESPSEVADALTDLLTPKEIETIAKRLQIAEYLVKGNDYAEVRSELKVGYSTIARVNTWLNLSGEGFKIMLSRKRKSPRVVPEEQRYDPYSWHNIKRRYSVYFWPQLLITAFKKTPRLRRGDELNADMLSSLRGELAFQGGEDVIEELIRSSDTKERKKIHQVFEKLQIKGRRFSGKKNKELYEQFSSEFRKRKIES